MKVAKCCESKEPELLTFGQIKKQEGVYSSPEFGNKSSRVFVVTDGLSKRYALFMYDGIAEAIVPIFKHAESYKFLRTSETLCVGLKDADGKWVE